MPQPEETVQKSITAKEIVGIDLVRMNNGAHFQFIKNVDDRITTETTITANPIAKAAADRLKAALKEEDACLAISRKSDITDDIMAADRERDALLTGYQFAVKGFLRSSAPDKAAAAETLWLNLKAHRINPDMQLDRETALITNLVDDCDKKYPTEVQKLGLAPYVESLKAVNAKVETLMVDRHKVRVTQTAGALRSARRASDAAYIRMVKVVNALAILHNDTAKCDAFIKFMNAEIKHYKEQVLTSKKRTDDTPDKPKEPKQPKEPKEPKQPEQPKDPKDPKQPEQPKPGGGDDIHLPEEPPKKPEGQ